MMISICRHSSEKTRRTITSHGSQVATLLQHFDDLILVLWEHLGETVGAFNKIVLGRAREAARE